MSQTVLDVRSGPAVVIASGEVTTFAGNGLVFGLIASGLPGRVELDFTTDADVEGVAVRTEELADGYRLNCVNFDSADGRGSAQPVLLGQVEDELLFFHFRVFLYGKTQDRTVHYTFYRVPQSAMT